MRYIFISLLLVNIALAVWGFSGVAETKVSPSSPGVLAPVLKTMSQEIVPRSDAPDPAEASPEMCELVGPFDQGGEAEAFVERLQSVEIEAVIKQIELPAGQSYWVHLPPEDSETTAYRKLAALQGQGIESYVIAQGELKNAVSLGVFTYPELADKRVDTAKAMGLDAQVTIVERTQIETWVSIRPEFVEKMSDLTWSRMLEGMGEQERRQNFCLPVAS
ncbi:SPOR domain-containing protein [Agaribacterium sp. ZY112]|uniref:SPOR domain-containing protein n=1 Tax=Agaribacterium sp. ZY112 TaxID=3233574 RepID=UPI003524A7C0